MTPDLKRLGAIPIIALAILIALTVILNNGKPVFNPPNLAFILQILFVLIASLIVAIISARGYLTNGSLNLVFLGSALLINGTITTLSVVPLGLSSNTIVTMANLGTLTSATILFLGAIITLQGTVPSNIDRRKIILTIGYILSILLIGFLIELALSNVLPVFLTSTGPTLLRRTVLAALIILLFASFVIFELRYFKTKSPILYWYSLAIALFGLAMVAAYFTVKLGDPMNWLSRITIYLSGIYFIIALFSRGVEAEYDEVLSTKWAEAFRSDRQQVEALFSNMLDAFVYCKILTDKSEKPVDYVYLYVNDAYERLLGVKRETFVGKRATEVFPALKNQSINFIEVVGQVALTGEPTAFENYFDFVNKWVHASVYSPKKGYFVTIFEDISERKKAEEALQQQKAVAQQERDRLSSLLNSITDGVWFADTEKKFTLANPSAAKEFKLDSSAQGVDVESLAESLEVLRPDGSPRPVEEAPPLRALKGEIIRNQEEIVRTPASGELKTRQVSSAPVKDNKGNIIGSVSVVRDVTELKQLQNRLQKYTEDLEKLVEERTFSLKASEEKYRTLFDSIDEGFCIIEMVFDNYKPLDYRFLEVNASFERQTGMHEAKGKLMRSFAPNHESYWFEIYGKVALTGQPIRFTNEAKELKRYYDVYAFPVGEGKIRNVGILFNDISQRRILESKLKDSERLAAIGATAGMVGHDIRNPLQAITSDVYLAKTELALTPESEEKKNAIESLVEIEKNIDYINKIVQDLQDYARPLNPNPGEADLKLIIDRLLAKNGVPKNVKLTVKVEPEARKFVADADYLNRILYNLITNAIQAMPKGGKLTITARNEANDMVIAVKDTGVGIPKEMQGKMFTPMFTTKSKGQGFGLPVVKRMTESLGGTVSFESKEGKGTTFTVRLPPSKTKQ